MIWVNEVIKQTLIANISAFDPIWTPLNRIKDIHSFEFVLGAFKKNSLPGGNDWFSKRSRNVHNVYLFFQKTSHQDMSVCCESCCKL